MTAYVKTLWADEVLGGAERFDINTNGGTPIYADVEIILSTSVTTVGTSVNAANLNHLEDGVVAISSGAARTVKGVAGSVSGSVEDIVASVDGDVLRRSGTGIGFGKLANTSLLDHKELVYLKVFWFDESLVVGNGKMFFTVPAYLAGTIVDFDISVIHASSSGLVTVQAANCGSNPAAVGTDILSVRATIDVNEWSSMTAATQPVITSGAIVSGDVIRIDVDVIGTGALGLDVFFVVEKSG